MGGKSAGRFGDCQNICLQKMGGICQQIWWLSETLPTKILGKPASRNWGANLHFLTVTKSASRFTPLFLLADFLTVTKSAGRFTSHFYCQIIWQSPNLLADLPLFLLADLCPPLIYAGSFSDSHQIYQQIYPSIYAGTFPNNHQIC